MLYAALTAASSKREKIGVLKFASATFDHGDEAIHDLEIEAGVVDTLSIYLTRAVDEDGGVKEAERICKLLVLVFQCEDKVAAESICKNGISLVSSVFKLLSKQARSETETKYAERLLRRLSSVEVSIQAVANNQVILKLLLDTIESSQNDKNTATKHALSLLAGLALHKDSKAIVMKFPGLFKAVVDVAYSSTVVENRYQSVRVLSQLAWYVKNRTTMGRTSKCIDALVAASDSTDEILQIEALTALQLLSIEYDNKAILVTNTKGKLLQSSVGVIDANTGDKLRAQALSILLNLISRETFKIIGFGDGLISSLAALSASPKEPDATAVLAAQCIKRLATYARVKDRFHEDLLQAIIQTSNSGRKSTMQWAAKAFLDQSRVSSNSFYIVRDQDAMKTVANLAACPYLEVREPTLEAVVNLAEHRSNAKKLASHNSLVGTLVSIIDGETKGNDTVLQRHAVRAILSLVSHRSSTKRIAKHLGLVRALSRYGISAQDTDVELKRAALHSVIILAPFL